MIWPFRAKTVESVESAPVDPSAILRRARRLRFRVRPGSLSILSGAYHASRPGVGLTFAELRAYEPGDDVRHIDWNVTARQGRPYVRRFIEERALALWLIVDVSASLRFGPEGRSKADRAAQAAALLATAASANGDRVGMTLVSDRVEAEIPPGTGDRHLARIIRALVATPTVSRQTDLAVGLSRMRRNTRRALVVVLSDFLPTEPSALPTAVWRRASRRHDVLALRLVEPREEALPAVGQIDVEDSERKQRGMLDSNSARVRAAYRRAADERRTAFRAWCVQSGVSGFEVPTDVDPVGVLIRIFHGRSAAPGGNRP